MKIIRRRQFRKSKKDQSSFAGIWKILAVGCLILSIGGTFFAFLVDPEMGINFSLNIATEAIGIVATIVFVQRHLDLANQKEVEQTNKIIKRNFNELKKSLLLHNDLKTKAQSRKKRYSITEYLQNKENRMKKKRDNRDKSIHVKT